MKITTKQITVTAIMVALCIVVQLFKDMGITFTWISGLNVSLSVVIVGSLVNLFIIIATLYSGWVSGLIVSILAPITSFIISVPAPIVTVPLILPCIMVANCAMVFFAWFVRGKKLELNLMPISLIIGSFVKYGIMTLLIVNWLIPSSNAELVNKGINVVVVSFQYSTVQLFAALLGTFLACITWPILKLSLKRTR